MKNAGFSRWYIAAALAASGIAPAGAGPADRNLETLQKEVCFGLALSLANELDRGAAGVYDRPGLSDNHRRLLGSGPEFYYLTCRDLAEVSGVRRYLYSGISEEVRADYGAWVESARELMVEVSNGILDCIGDFVVQTNRTPQPMKIRYEMWDEDSTATQWGLWGRFPNQRFVRTEWDRFGSELNVTIWLPYTAAEKFWAHTRVAPLIVEQFEEAMRNPPPPPPPPTVRWPPPRPGGHELQP